jgi:hypothetical protein
LSSAFPPAWELAVPALVLVALSAAVEDYPDVLELAALC